MKYENFKEASEIVKAIDDYKDIVSTLEAGWVIMVSTSNSCKNTFIETGIHSAEDEFYDLSKEYTDKIIRHCQSKLKALNEKLEKL